MSDPEYLLLRNGIGWYEEDQWPRLLGAVVRNYLAPLDDSVPTNPFERFEEDPYETKFEGFILRNNTSDTQEKKFSIKGLGMFRSRKSDDNAIDLSGKVIFVKRFHQHVPYWRRLVEDKHVQAKLGEWFQEKEGFVRKKPKNVVCLVVALLLCQDVDIAETSKEAEDRERQGQVLLGTITEQTAAVHGVPLKTNGTGDVEVQKSKQQARKTYFKAHGKDTYVFALELRKIEMTDDSEYKLRDKGPSSGHKLSGKGSKEIEFTTEILCEADWDDVLADDAPSDGAPIDD
ncbi:hypothetical protein ANO11243_094010 [Dothideomycetidae sp. 11243]|nr:hypothetical protein ANO11243_094010 [fungal sp. No.11243]